MKTRARPWPSGLSVCPRSIVDKLIAKNCIAHTIRKLFIAQQKKNLIDLGGGPERANLSFKSFDTQYLYEADGSRRLRTTRIGGEGGSCPCALVRVFHPFIVYGVRERGAFSAWDDRRERKNASRRRRRGKSGTLQKNKGSTGKCQCRTHHRERTACWRRLWRRVGICVEESENAVCSVCGTTGESARMPAEGGGGGKAEPYKKTRGRRGSVNAVRTTGSGQRVGGVCGEGWGYGAVHL
jgi:hypothetical protein